MRIIAGELRGRRIAPPEGRDTRPMLDRVREALFSTLGSVLEDAPVLDLFAGTGSLGLEALSRGASRARFVERDRRALRLLRENVETLGVADRAEMVGGDALAAAQWSFASDATLAPAVAFLDPPYRLLRERAGRARLLAAARALAEEVLAPGGVVVLHAHPRDLRAGELHAAAEQRVYGNSALWYVRV